MEITDEEKELIRKVNIDKAKNKTNMGILFITLSLLTYLIPIMLGDFDFGIVFEIISLICIIIARYYMSKYDEIKAKRYTIVSMLSIGWILVYDIIFIIASIKDIGDLLLGSSYFFWGEIFSLSYLAELFVINMNLSKADNPEKYKESTDWFYERKNGRKLL